MKLEQFKINPNCSDCPIRHRAVCSSCEPDELSRLDAIKFYKSFTAGQPIAFQGDALDIVASVVDGTATLESVIEDGRTQIVGLLLPSDFLGRPGRKTLNYNVTAVSDVTICAFKREPFERLLREIPHLQERLLQMALDELDAAREWMLLLGRKTAREKIASLLVSIMRRARVPEAGALGAGTTLHLPLGREAIANFLGLTLETVSRQFSALRKDGLIELQGKRTVIIKDLEALLTESGDDADGGPIA